MAADWNRCLRRPAASLLGCLLALLLVKSLSSQSWGFAGPALQPRSAARRSALLLRAEGPAAQTSLDDLFSSDDVTPKQLPQAAKEATTSALDAVKVKSGMSSFDVWAYADSVGSATVTKLMKLFPALEPQLSSQDPKQVGLAVGVAAVAFLSLLVFANSSSTTNNSAVNPKAAGGSASSSTTTTNTSSGTPAVSNATSESRGTPVVSSQQSVLTVSETSDPEPPSASAQVKSDVIIEMTDRNAIKSAGFIALIVGYAYGGIWLGVALFIAASWAGTRRTDEFATAVKGLGRNGIKVVNFGGYLEGKYRLSEQLGSSIANASSSVKEEYKQASAVIDSAASVVGVVLENEASIQDSVDSITTAATGAACLAGDAAELVLNKTVDVLGELGEHSSKDSGQDIGSSTSVKAPVPSQTEQPIPRKQQVQMDVPASAPSSAKADKELVSA